MNVIVKYPSVTVSALVTAPCETLFSIVSDPMRHPELAGSGEVMETRWLTPLPVQVGSGFQSRQCVGWYQYPSRSYVQVYEPPHRFIWLSGPGFKRAPFGQLWGFDLKPLDARTTLVSHMMKVPYLPLPDVPPFISVAERISQHEENNMRPTLHKLARAVGAQIIGDLQVTFDWCTNADEAPCAGANAVTKNSVIQARPAK
jgi:hypothetical protein